MATHSSILAWRESHGWRSLVGYSPRSCKESDTTERLRLQGFWASALLYILIGLSCVSKKSRRLISPYLANTITKSKMVFCFPSKVSLFILFLGLCEFLQHLPAYWVKQMFYITYTLYLSKSIVVLFQVVGQGILPSG